MARVVDLWHTRARKRTSRYGTGKRWQAVWTVGGKEHKASFSTKDAAAEHLIWIEHQRRSGTYISPDRGRVLIGPLLDDWAKTLTHLRPSSLEGVENNIERVLRPELGQKTLASLEHAELQSWLTGLDRGARTKELTRTYLQQFLAWNIKSKRIMENPASGLKLPTQAPRTKNYLTPDQLAALVAKTTSVYQDFVLFLALTGLRVGEAAELRVGDLDLPRGRFTVNRSAVFLASGLWVGLPKNGKPRTLVIGQTVSEVLARLAEGKGAGDLVFTSAQGTQIRPKNFKRRHFDTAVKAAGLPDGFRVHDLRHTAASWAIHAGASVLAVQRMLGHASPTITLDVYAELFEQDLEGLAGRMDRLASKVRTTTKPPQED